MRKRPPFERLPPPPPGPLETKLKQAVMHLEKARMEVAQRGNAVRDILNDLFEGEKSAVPADDPVVVTGGVEPARRRDEQNNETEPERGTTMTGARTRYGRD